MEKQKFDCEYVRAHRQTVTTVDKVDQDTRTMIRDASVDTVTIITL